MSVVRIGVYGAGQMGSVHARTLAGFAGVSVVGVADADESRARATAVAAGAEPCPDLNTLLAMRLDAVFVAVPNIHHAQSCITALERGVHVFCEKPRSSRRRSRASRRLSRPRTRTGRLNSWTPVIGAPQPTGHQCVWRERITLPTASDRR